MTRQMRQFYAMGSHMIVWLDSDADVLDNVVAQFASAEKRFSRFLPNSELNQLNQRAGAWCAVSAEFWPLLKRALALSAETNGLFDPTILNALEAVGYRRSFDQLAPNDATHKRISPIDQKIEIDEAQQAVKLPAGTRLDLGGIAKGWTAQRVVDDLRSFGPCLLDAGGDLVAGAAPAGQPGWPVGIAAPWQRDTHPQKNLLRLWLADGALATSGVDYRQWQQQGQRKHHIIDPRCGDSAETDLLTATVLAAAADSAEAWATAALVAGRATATKLLTAHNLKAALIDDAQHLTLTPALQPLVQYEAELIA